MPVQSAAAALIQLVKRAAALRVLDADTRRTGGMLPRDVVARYVASVTGVATAPAEIDWLLAPELVSGRVRYVHDDWMTSAPL